MSRSASPSTDDAHGGWSNDTTVRPSARSAGGTANQRVLELAKPCISTTAALYGPGHRGRPGHADDRPMTGR
jgi:hypothetical protein